MNLSKLGSIATFGVVLGLAAGAGARAEECQGAPGAAKISIVVEGVRSDKGLMTASLYPGDKSQFLIKNGAVKVWSVPAQAPVTRLCIWRSPGTYALAVYHDVASVHRFTVGMFGPTQDYGFSNNPRILFSKPSFESVRFQAKAGETILHIRLNRHA